MVKQYFRSTEGITIISISGIFLGIFMPNIHDIKENGCSAIDYFVFSIALVGIVSGAIIAYSARQN
jgi:hypothetical protein